MSCLTTVNYSINFNGVLLDAFQPTRGLRQGDPFSPYLFLFVADSLSALLSHEEQVGSITPIRVSPGVPLQSPISCARMTACYFSEQMWQKQLG